MGDPPSRAPRCTLIHCLCDAFFPFFFFFSTCLVQSILAGLPLRSCLDQWGTLCARVFPNVHFRCCYWRDSNPCRRNLYKKCQRLNDIGHCDTIWATLIPATRWSCSRPPADSNDCPLQLHLVAVIRGAQISITGLVLSALSL